MSRIALVTGGAQRLGRQICLALAARGDTVVIHYKTSDQEAARTRDDCLAAGAAAAFTVRADLAAAADRATLMDAVLRLTGDLHLIVNNASLFAYDQAASFTPASFEQHLQTNFIAPVELTMALHRHHSQRQAPAGQVMERGHVVTLLDQKLENLNTDYLSYTLAKLGSGASIRYLAQCCAPLLRVNAISPGVSLVSGDMTPAEFESAQKIAALGQSSTPQDIASLATWLASPRSNFATGAIWTLDGGQVRA